MHTFSTLGVLALMVEAKNDVIGKVLLCQLVLYLTPAERTGLTSQQLFGGFWLAHTNAMVTKEKVGDYCSVFK